MDLGVLVQVGVSCAPGGSCFVHGRADGGEGGGEVVEILGERGARVSDWVGDESHPSLMLLESRDEGGVLFRLFVISLS